MVTRKSAVSTAALTLAPPMRKELIALCAMPLDELVAKHLAVFGVPTRSHNVEYLRRKIAYRLQEQREGGLSARAIDRIAELAPQARVRARQPLLSRGALEAAAKAATTTANARDPRLPAPGTIITRMHDSVEHRVTVLEQGFEYQGVVHRSLSKVAKLITGRDWNGFRFFFGNSNAKESNA